jgi:hypothetical protein
MMPREIYYLEIARGSITVQLYQFLHASMYTRVKRNKCKK